MCVYNKNMYLLTLFFFQVRCRAKDIVPFIAKVRHERPNLVRLSLACLSPVSFCALSAH